jgi:hypothetical protein
VGKAAQADYSSNYECSHGVDGGQKGNVQWPYMRRTTLGEVRRLNKAPTELAPYNELMRCSGTIFGGKGNRRQPTVMELTCIIGKFTVNTNVRE